MTSYQFTHLAQQDLREIKSRILEDNGPDVARKIILELRDKLELLASFPTLGRPRPELTDENVFFVPFYSWMIVYDPEMKPLRIVRLFSSYRHPESL